MKHTKLYGRLWLTRQQQNFLGHGRIALLEHIADYGSISKAAKAMKMGYKAAWDSVNVMNSLADKPLVVRISGGKGGGGTQLTEYAHELIRGYKQLEYSHYQYLQQLEQQYQHSFNLTPPSSLPSNQYVACIEKIESCCTLSHIFLQCTDDISMQVLISNTIFATQNLQCGHKVKIAVAPNTIQLISAQATEQYSMANQFPATVEYSYLQDNKVIIIMRLSPNITMMSYQQPEQLELFHQGDQVRILLHASQLTLITEQGSPSCTV